MEKEWNLQKRTKKFCIDCIQLAEKLPHTFLGNHVRGQLIRSSSSVAANYRAANLAQSSASFVAKTSIVIEESDESQFWLELISDFNLIESETRAQLESEAAELTAIFVASRKKMQNRKFN